MGRVYTSEEPTTCGICRRPVLLVRIRQSTCLMEPDPTGRARAPHRCPDHAIEQWEHARAVRKMIEGAKQL